MKSLKVLVLLSFVALASACSVKGSVDDLTTPVVTPRLGQQTGLTSGSQQNQIVGGGYRVSASLGDMTTGIQQKTADGYTVYGSVQGNIAAETMETTYQ